MKSQQLRMTQGKGKTRFTDPDRRPSGYVAITCTEHGAFVAWCSPPPPPCRVACSSACADDGLACIHCGEPFAGPHEPAGRSATGSQVFTCVLCAEVEA